MAKNTAILQNIDESQVQDALQAMELDNSLKTDSSFSANAMLYPDGQIPFIEKHLAYLKNHPRLDREQYLSNLRLMIRIRS